MTIEQILDWADRTERDAPSYLAQWAPIADDYRRRAREDGLDDETIDGHIEIVRQGLADLAVHYAKPMGMPQ